MPKPLDPRDAALQARIDKLKEGNVHYPKPASTPPPVAAQLTPVKPKVRKAPVPTVVAAAAPESATPVVAKTAKAKESNFQFFVRTVFKPMFPLVGSMVQTDKAKPAATTKTETTEEKSSALADAAAFIGKTTWSLVKFAGKALVGACKAFADLLTPKPKAITVKVDSPRAGTVEITATGATSVTVNTPSTPAAGNWKSEGQALNAMTRNAKVPERGASVELGAEVVATVGNRL